jgi:type VI secretion system protein ImpH
VSDPAALLSLTPTKRFFELMRRIDALQAQRPAGPRAAAGRRPGWLRMEQSAAMHFASAEVTHVTVLPQPFGAADAWPDLRVVQRHFGLFAPYGPLPLHFTEHAMLEKRYERNPAFEQFLNLVSTDMAWLHYRAWSSMHPALGYERARHPFLARIGSLSRADANSCADDQADAAHPARCRRSWPGLYVGPQRPLAGLQRLLRRYLQTPISTMPRGGRWLSVPTGIAQGKRLGRWRLGSRVWDAQNTLDIVVGPIDADQFHLWHRRAPAVRALVAVVTDYAAGAVQPAVHVLVRTRPEMAGRIGRMRVGVDTWAHPGHQLARLTVHESFETSP